MVSRDIVKVIYFLPELWFEETGSGDKSFLSSREAESAVVASIISSYFVDRSALSNGRQVP